MSQKIAFAINDSNSIRLREPNENSADSSPSSQHNDLDSVYSARKITEEEESRWIQFKYYSLYNSIRFLLIAVLVCYANFHNQHQIDGYTKYCCDCYYIAQNPTYYGIGKAYRIDWSYCLPKCVDCHYCQNYYNGNATAAFDSYEKCPAKGYDSHYSGFSWNWYAHSKYFYFI